MSDTVPVAPISSSGGQTPRGGRRRGGPRANNPYYTDANQRGNNFRGGRGEYGARSRGRGGSGNSTFMPDTQSRISNGQPPDQPYSGGRVNDHIDAGHINRGQVGQQAVEIPNQLGEEGEVCFICASRVEHLSITPCNHQTCHICALRLRALYKKRDCAYCKVSSTDLELSRM